MKRVIMPNKILSTGFGQGLVLLNALLLTQPYFDKRKALAIGITAGGSGVGTLTIPNILRQLFDHLSFTEAVLVYGRFYRWITGEKKCK